MVRITWRKDDGKEVWRERVLPFLVDGALVKLEYCEQGNKCVVSGDVWFDAGMPRVGVAWIGSSTPDDSLESITFPNCPAWEGAEVIHAPRSKKNFYRHGRLYFEMHSRVGFTAHEMEEKYGDIEIKIV